MRQYRVLCFLLILPMLVGSVAGARDLAGSRSPAAAATRSQEIVAIGDSITFGLHDEAAQGGWVGRLADMMHILYPRQHYATVNAGINGDTSAGVLKRLNHDVMALNPDLVILAIGTNDFDYHVPAATFAVNLRAILTGIRQHTHAAILVQSFLPQAHVSTAALKQEAAYNAIVPAVCRSMKVGYEDLFNTFLALGSNALTNLRHDSEHPTAAGYSLMAAVTLAVLEAGYLTPQGTLVQAANAPGIDDLLPDNELA